MTKINVQYKGFAIGFRCIETLALDYKPGNAIQVSMLHAVRNLALNDQLMALDGACGINGQPYRA